MSVCVLALCAAFGIAAGQPPTGEPMVGPPAEEPVVGPPATRDAFLTDKVLKERAEAQARAAAQRMAVEKHKQRQQQPDRDTIGERLAECARIVPGDLVLVRGGARDAALLQSIAGQVRRRGGSPLVALAGDRMEVPQFDQAPAEFDARPNELELKLAAEVTAVIDVEADESPTDLAHVPGARQAARARGVALADEVMRRRGVRRVELGNGLYPSEHLAADCSLSEDELSRVFWLAATADASEMHETGAMVRDSLVGEGRAAITNPNGTDLKFRFAAAPKGAAEEMGMMAAAAGAPADNGKDPAAKRVAAAINDGSVAGALPVRLPAGELYAMAMPGTAEGRIVADRLLFNGREVTGLTVTFRAGRVTGISARSGSEYIRKVYDASGAGKDQLGAVIIGLNPDLRPPSGVKLCSTIPLGMISVVIGGNAQLGGENTESFSLPVCLPGCTLRVDGRPVIEEGELTPTSPLPPDEEEAPAPPSARQ
jgi:leucyl aminopeptidase (aminopeptidase T)